MTDDEYAAHANAILLAAERDSPIEVERSCGPWEPLRISDHY
jgi:hypothetical protein